ncbi:hypothetical protein LCGC14_2239660, partial [marine sediment metagenome]
LGMRRQQRLSAVRGRRPFANNRSATLSKAECEPDVSRRLADHLEVKRVWVEQAQDIPPIDTLAEGICLPEPRNVNTNEPPPEFPTWTKKRQEEWIEGQARAIYFCRCHDVENHIVAFHNLWDSTWAIKGFPWDDNPWVFAAEFSLIENTKARAES